MNIGQIVKLTKDKVPCGEPNLSKGSIGIIFNISTGYKDVAYYSILFENGTGIKCTEEEIGATRGISENVRAAFNKYLEIRKEQTKIEKEIEALEKKEICHY